MYELEAWSSSSRKQLLQCPRNYALTAASPSLSAIPHYLLFWLRLGLNLHLPANLTFSNTRLYMHQLQYIPSPRLPDLIDIAITNPHKGRFLQSS
jgi:hypothetical protein